MATEYKLNYTASEINTKLGKIDTLESALENAGGGVEIVNCSITEFPAVGTMVENLTSDKTVSEIQEMLENGKFVVLKVTTTTIGTIYLTMTDTWSTTNAYFSCTPAGDDRTYWIGTRTEGFMVETTINAPMKKLYTTTMTKDAAQFDMSISSHARKRYKHFRITGQIYGDGGEHSFCMYLNNQSNIYKGYAGSISGLSSYSVQNGTTYANANGKWTTYDAWGDFTNNYTAHPGYAPYVEIDIHFVNGECHIITKSFSGTGSEGQQGGSVMFTHTVTSDITIDNFTSVNFVGSASFVEGAGSSNDWLSGPRAGTQLTLWGVND